MKVLVTGGAGFIGSTLVKLLLEESYEVVVLDNFSSGLKENLAGLSNVKLIEGDIRNRDAVGEALEGARVVFHTAAHLAQVRSLENPLLDSDVNVLGTLQLLEAARREGVKKIVYSSSTAVYGEATRLPIDEDHPLNPESPYGVSKLAAEKHCISYSRIYDIDAICLRYFNVYGPRQRPDVYGSVTSTFVTRVLNDQPLVIYGDGEQSRDFVHVYDICRANILAGQSQGLRGVFNVASGIPVTVNRLATIVQDTAGKKADVEYQPSRKGDVLHNVGDISLARSKLGFEPQINIRRGIEEYVDWMRESAKIRS